MEKKNNNRVSTFKKLSKNNEELPLEAEIRKIFKLFKEKKIFKEKMDTVLKFKNNISFGSYLGDIDLKINPDAYKIGNVAVVHGDEINAFIYYSIIANGDSDSDTTGYTLHLENSSTSKTDFFEVLTMLLVVAAKINGSRITMSKNILSLKNKGKLLFARNKVNNKVAYEYAGTKKDAMRTLKNLLSDITDHTYGNQGYLEFHKTVAGMVAKFNTEFEKCEKTGWSKGIYVYRPRFEFLNKFDVKSIRTLKNLNTTCSNFEGPAFGIASRDVTNGKMTSYLLFNEIVSSRGNEYGKAIQVEGTCTDAFYKDQKVSFFLGLLLLASVVQHNDDFKFSDRIHFVTSSHDLSDDYSKVFSKDLKFKRIDLHKKHGSFTRWDKGAVRGKLGIVERLTNDDYYIILSKMRAPIGLFYYFNKKNIARVYKVVNETFMDICGFWNGDLDLHST